jgi:hypothetical protein
LRDNSSVGNVEDLSRSVTSSGNIFAISAEPYAAHDTFVSEVVDKINIKHSTDTRIEDSIPVTAFALEVRCYKLRIKFG